MHTSTEVDLGEDGKVCVLELRVRDLRAWLKQSEQAKSPSDDAFGQWLFAELTLTDLLVFTDLTVEDIEDLAPSQLARIIEEIKTVNAVFFNRVAQLQPATRAATV
jgi:hypothetical protein